MAFMCPEHAEVRCPVDCATIREWRALKKAYGALWRDRQRDLDARHCLFCGRVITLSRFYTRRRFCSETHAHRQANSVRLLQRTTVAA